MGFTVYADLTSVQFSADLSLQFDFCPPDECKPDVRYGKKKTTTTLWPWLNVPLFLTSLFVHSLALDRLCTVRFIAAAFAENWSLLLLEGELQSTSAQKSHKSQTSSPQPW